MRDTKDYLIENGSATLQLVTLIVTFCRVFYSCNP